MKAHKTQGNRSRHSHILTPGEISLNLEERLGGKFAGFAARPDGNAVDVCVKKGPWTEPVLVLVAGDTGRKYTIMEAFAGSRVPLGGGRPNQNSFYRKLEAVLKEHLAEEGKPSGKIEDSPAEQYSAQALEAMFGNISLE